MKLTLYIDLMKWEIIPTSSKNTMKAINRRTGKAKTHYGFGWLCINFCLAK